MKVIITASEPRLDAPLDPRFGRAKVFIVADTETGAIAIDDNTPNLNAPQGAGIQAAARVVELGAQAVLTGHVGPKAYRALEAAKVAVYAVSSGTASEALESFKQGRIEPVTAATVEGHWV